MKRSRLQTIKGTNGRILDMKYFCVMFFLLCSCFLPGCQRSTAAEDKAYVAAYIRATEEIYAIRKADRFTPTAVDARLADLARLKSDYQKAPPPSRFTETDKLLLAAIAEQETALLAFQAYLKDHSAEKLAESRSGWNKVIDLMGKSGEAGAAAGGKEVADEIQGKVKSE